MTVISFNLCVSVALAVLLARFFQEGQVITAFQLLVPPAWPKCRSGGAVSTPCLATTGSSGSI